MDLSRILTGWLQDDKGSTQEASRKLSDCKLDAKIKAGFPTALYSACRLTTVLKSLR